MGSQTAARSKVERWLDRLPRLLRRRGVEAAYLFGSRARGSSDAESDIDLLVVTASERPFVDRFQDFPELWLGAPAAVDLLIYTPEEFAHQRRSNRFVRNALRHARRMV